MPKKSKINIFNRMSESQLDNALRSLDCSTRYYQRLVAMKLIATGHSHKQTSEILQVSYRSVNRWAKTCQDKGLEGLNPKFNGGKPSKLSDEDKVKFKHIITNEEDLTIKDAQKILAEDFGIEFTLPHVSNIVKEMGVKLKKSHPRKAPKKSHGN